MTIREITDITGFHAHVYFNAATRKNAETLREALGARFSVRVGAWHEKPVGPHPKAMYQVAFALDQFGPFVTWLMLNRDGLSILAHPLTGDEVADHTKNTLWLGEPLPLDIDCLRRYVEHRAREGVSA
jgi:aromatic ring-cleaving dioxygenase